VAIDEAALAALEQRSLRWSMAAAVVLSVLGVTWGVVTSSQVILFDGMYGVLGIGLTWLSMVASRLVVAAPTPKYPFGREALAPLVIAVQGVALLAACVYASIDAVVAIAHGGNEVAAGSALGYGVVTGLGTVVAWLLLRGPASRSELLAAERAQWLASVALSLAVIVAFTLVIALERGGLTTASRYVDPVLVLLVCAALMPVPVRMVRTTLVELLEGAPDPEVQAPVRAAVHDVRELFGLDEPYLRMTKVGNKLYVEADFVVPPGEWHVDDEDRIRRAVLERLAPLPYAIWLNVELTSDPGLAL
jgi:predicted Co/Zn/Cd cation transporter (cation efflux family)